MLVKAKIIEVETRDHKGKQVADVMIKTSDPSNVFVTTLWNNSIREGAHKPYAELAGHTCMIALRPEIFNGNIQYNLYTSVPPVAVK